MALSFAPKSISPRENALSFSINGRKPEREQRALPRPPIRLKMHALRLNASDSSGYAHLRGKGKLAVVSRRGIFIFDSQRVSSFVKVPADDAPARISDNDTKPRLALQFKFRVQ